MIVCRHQALWLEALWNEAGDMMATLLSLGHINDMFTELCIVDEM